MQNSSAKRLKVAFINIFTTIAGIRTGRLVHMHKAAQYGCIIYFSYIFILFIFLHCYL